MQLKSLVGTLVGCSDEHELNCYLGQSIKARYRFRNMENWLACELLRSVTLCSFVQLAIPPSISSTLWQGP